MFTSFSCCFFFELCNICNSSVLFLDHQLEATFEIPLESCVEGIQVSPESYHYQLLKRLLHWRRECEQETVGTMHNSVDVFNVPSKRKLMQIEEMKEVPRIKLSVVATKTRQETCRDLRMLKSKGQVRCAYTGSAARVLRTSSHSEVVLFE